MQAQANYQRKSREKTTIDENTVLIIERERPTGLGVGAFGSVFLGEYNYKECALKVLNYDASGLRSGFYSPKGKKKEEVEQFIRECAILENFVHKNVVRHLYTTVHPKSGNPILVMELLDCNLSRFVTSDEYKHTLTLQCEISISKDVACGLGYIHNLPEPVIHRDLCGQNVLLKLNESNIPVAKIADFGLSKLFERFKKNTTLNHRRGYLPPEAFHEEVDENGTIREYDLSLDIFSCGVIMMQIALRVDNVENRRKRNSYLDQFLQFENQVCTVARSLGPCIVDCLKEDKTQRPSAVKLCKYNKCTMYYSCTLFHC